MRRNDLFIPMAVCVIALMLFACKDRKMSGGQKGTELSERCAMKHDPGPCRGAFTRYYYDQEKGKCVSFIYGGCQGVVPFETLEDCQAACAQK